MDVARRKARAKKKGKKGGKGSPKKKAGKKGAAAAPAPAGAPAGAPADESVVAKPVRPKVGQATFRITVIAEDKSTSTCARRRHAHRAPPAPREPCFARPFVALPRRLLRPERP